MTPERFKRAEELYFEVQALPPGERRAAIDARCGGDASLRDEVLSLLGTTSAAAGFLETPALGSSIADAIAPQRLSEEDLSGASLGPWRLERRLAAGGMGAVYVAQRADGQFQQRAAVKVVKRGLDTDEILRRFKAERQTLAALNHPNIARILDGGATESGRPYLVMEFVEGRPIDDYCEQAALDVADRVRLMRTVCEAVRTAHQALVVHRDLKPSNILVDDAGNPKLLDFGIAKVLTTPDGTAAATLTTDAERRLTPEYASPEQVMGEPIGTASDVYSLGVILYELLAGARPYAFERFARAEIERVVCFTTPPPPSAAAARINAGGDGARRARALRGDLDTIVLMAMRKEPVRRYGSVDALIADLDAYLENRPVSARPDTVTYRVSKFVRRNPLAMVAVLALVAGVIGTSWQARAAMRQRDEANRARDEAEQSEEFLRRALAAADPSGLEGPQATVSSFVTAAELSVRIELADKPIVQAKMLDAIGRAYVQLGLLDRAEQLCTEAFNLRRERLPTGHHDLAESHLSLGQLRIAQRRLEDALLHLGEAREVFEAIAAGAPSLDTAEAWNEIGVAQRLAGQPARAIEAHQAALRIRTALAEDPGATDAQRRLARLRVAESLNNLGLALADRGERGDRDASDSSIAQAAQIRRELLPENHPLVVQTLQNEAVFAARRRDLSLAAAKLERAVALGPSAYGPDSGGQAVLLNSIAGVYFSQAAALLAEGADPSPLLSKAEAAYREALRIRTLRLGPDHAQTLSTARSLGRTLIRRADAGGEADDAAGAEGAAMLLDALRRSVDQATGKLDAHNAAIARELIAFHTRRAEHDRAAQAAALVPDVPPKNE